jgi:hypothetical protein
VLAHAAILPSQPTSTWCGKTRRATAPDRSYGVVVEIRTDRVGLLVEQLTDSAAFARARLEGLTDEELLWEPVTPAWSVRRRGASSTPDAYGPGEYVLDLDRAFDPFAVGPFTTIAWRIGHLTSAFAGRYEWTFGARVVTPEDVVHFEPRAAPMLTRLWAEIERWTVAVEAMTDDQLDTPGFGQYPRGLDPELPFIGIVRWMNRETIHHLAEVALLRDLYAHHLE